MARETLGYVNLEWVCPKCNTRNPGLEKVCLGCGAPQPESVQFVQASGVKASQDEELKKIAEKGADIHCAFCGTRNPADALTCSQCGAELKSGIRRDAGKVIGAYRPEEVKQIPCPNCGTLNPETSSNCSQCGSPLGRSQVMANQAAGINPDQSRSKIFLYIGLAALVFICIVAAVGLFFASSSRETRLGTVQSVNWQTAVAIEALRPVTRQAWKEAIPPEAEIGACQKKVYAVVDYQPAGEDFNRICGTPYTIDTGSGVGEIVQDCKFEILHPYCEYRTQEWQIVDEARLQGNDLNPIFADPVLGTDQRSGAKNAKLSVIFKTDEGQFSYPLSSLEEFRSFSIGSQWNLNLNAFGQIVSIEPAR